MAERDIKPARWNNICVSGISHDTAHVSLEYPPYTDAEATYERVRYVELDLCAVRAADSIRIYYDFARNGWAIMQASKFSWSEDDIDQGSDWQEVAFVRAWARKADGD